MEDPKADTSDAGLKLNDILALERTRMAAERTLMAWIRTSLALMTFGFTLFHFLKAVQEQSKLPVLRPNAPRNVGLTLIGLGICALIVASVHHWRYVRKLNPARPFRPWDLSNIVACLLVLLGLLMIAGVIYRSGPFG